MKNMEPQSKWQVFSQNLFNLLMLGLAVYFIYLIGQLAWKNYHIDQKISDLEKQTEIMGIENQSLNDYLVYYKSKVYQELELRRRLMLKKPGENVVLLPIREDDDRTVVVAQEKKLVDYENNQKQIPNYYKWWLLVTNGKI